MKMKIAFMFSLFAFAFSGSVFADTPEVEEISFEISLQDIQLDYYVAIEATKEGSFYEANTLFKNAILTSAKESVMKNVKSNSVTDSKERPFERKILYENCNLKNTSTNANTSGGLSRSQLS